MAASRCGKCSLGPIVLLVQYIRVEFNVGKNLYFLLRNFLFYAKISGSDFNNFIVIFKHTNDLS